MTKTTRRDLLAELCEIEPGIVALARDVAAVKDDGSRPSFCANQWWYRNGLRERLIRLVGWDRKADGIAVLASPEAYDVTYDALYRLLPDCRNCGCA